MNSINERITGFEEQLRIKDLRLSDEVIQRRFKYGAECG